MTANPLDKLECCPVCGDRLERTPCPAHLNADQWASIRAGEFYCPRLACAGWGNTAGSQGGLYAYFNRPITRGPGPKP